MLKKILRADAAYVWIAIAIASSFLLPWFTLQDGLSFENYSAVFASGDASNLWYQAGSESRYWLAFPIGAIGLACLHGLFSNRRLQGRVLIAAGIFGLVTTIGFGLAIGIQGWNAASLKEVLPFTMGQPGLGWGGALIVAAFLALFSMGVARLGYFRGDGFIAWAVTTSSAVLLLFVAFPVLKSLSGAFFDESDQLHLASAAARIFNERIWGLNCLAGGSCGVAWNTLFLGLATAAGTTILGLLLALLTERSLKRAKPVARLLATLPFITPPFVVGMGLLLLFGRSGVVNVFLESTLGIQPSRWFYGATGVWLAQMFAFTPIAFLMIRSMVQAVSPSLEEAAQTLHANPMQAMRTVTLPLLKPGLTNTFLVGFIESMADFGNPILLGGQFAVLSTEIFFAIVGAQLDQGKAAGLALVLSFFALSVFALQRYVLGKASYVTVSGKGDNGLAPALPKPIRILANLIAMPWLAFTVIVYLLAFTGGFVKIWGRDYTLTLKHFETAFGFEMTQHGVMWTGTAWESFWTTMQLAGASAPVTALLGMLIAFLLARTRFKGQSVFEFAALLAFAIPGTVLGVSYILAFNVPPFELTGTALIIFLCFVFRNLPVSIRSGSAAFSQLDKSLDEASVMLGASTVSTLRRIILPLLRPALIASLIYAFVRATTTVSSVIFLVTAETELATTYIIGRVGNGDYGIALAYCTFLTVVMLLAIGLVQLLVGERKLGRRSAQADVSERPSAQAEVAIA